VTSALPPVTCAVNCAWLGESPDGGTKAYAGERAMVTMPDDVIVICAELLFDESALLVAVSTTGLDAGTVDGARKSTLVAVGPEGGWHGFVPVKHTCPSVAFPLAMPLTVQSTVASGVFDTSAENVARPLTGTLALGGVTLTVTLLTMVTVADAVTVPAVA